VIADDPIIRGYHTARYILAEVFGQDWADENAGPAKPGGFLKNDFSDGDEAATAAHFMRVTALAEMLLNADRPDGRRRH